MSAIYIITATFNDILTGSSTQVFPIKLSRLHLRMLTYVARTPKCRYSVAHCCAGKVQLNFK